MYVGKFDTVMPLDKEEAQKYIDACRSILERDEDHSYRNSEIVYLRTIAANQERIAELDHGLAEKYGTDIATMWEQLEQLQAKVEKAYAIAQNAIYFNDNSDYLPALHGACKALKPEVSYSEVGKKYIEEK
jgi:hypothetical protein